MRNRLVMILLEQQVDALLYMKIATETSLRNQSFDLKMRWLIVGAQSEVMSFIYMSVP